MCLFLWSIKKIASIYGRELNKEVNVKQSFRRMFTIVRKEWLHIIRDPRTLGLVIIMPVMMLFLLGYAVANDVTDMPMVVADLSQTESSRTLVDKLVVSGFFKYTYAAQSESEILKLLDEGNVKVGLYIPENFGRNLSTGGTGTIQFYIDGSNPTVAQTAQLAAETISQSMSQEILINRLERSGSGMQLNLPVDARLRYLYNPDMKRMNFMIPGLVAIILQIQTLLLTAFAIVREREQGTLEQLIVTPVRSWELMLGKILPFVVVAFVNVVMTVSVGAIWFGVEVAGSITLLGILSLIFLLGSLGLGVFISNISKTQMQAMYMASFIMMPSFILAGLLFPRENMPWLAYYAGYLLPVTYFLEIVRGIILKGAELASLWVWIWPMAVFSIVVFFASVLMFQKRL
jgi:ABC-2 type transport system permease protein